jgi:ubiquinone/menaquinone biosynthesis C-methylase UbiE
MTGGPLPGAAAAFDAAADCYDATGTEFFTILAATLVRAAGIRPGDRVLDAGCGKGAATIPSARAAGPRGRVTALDGSPDMLAGAERAARQAGLDGIRWLHADAEDPPLPPGSLDVILASSVIQFLATPRRAARHWLALLAPGGTLAISWGLAQDPAWLPVMAVFDAAVPAPHPAFERFLRRPPFDSPAAMSRFLIGIGYTAVTTGIQPITSVYTNPRQWWDATRGQAPYLISWQHIPPDALHAAKAEAFALLESMRGPDATIRRTLQFGLTTARAPSG